MQNITKFSATLNQIRMVFQAADLGEIADIKEISDGWFNRIFSVVAADKKYVLKLAPPKSVQVLSYEKNLMASEVKFYQLLREKTAIKTPQIVYVDFSEKIIPTAYFIMEFLSGERMDKAELSPSEKKKADEQMAWILSEFHKVKNHAYGYEQVGLCDNWIDTLTSMTQMLINDAKSFGRQCKIGKKLLFYIDRFKDELKNVPCVFVNFDLNMMNVFCERMENGDLQLSVLDLERGFWGDPIGDFVTLEPLKRLGKKNILAHYNNHVTEKVIAGNNNVEIRYNLMTAYLAAIVYVERFSRFKGLGKYINITYLIGTIASKLLAKQAFSALKKLQIQRI